MKRRHESRLVFSMMAHRIIIVEDDEDIRELCRDILEAAGFSVETCANGQEALLSLDAHSDPCLIFLHMLMPIMNGTEFMAEFAKRPHTNSQAAASSVSVAMVFEPLSALTISHGKE